MSVVAFIDASGWGVEHPFLCDGDLWSSQHVRVVGGEGVGE